jgi:valine dehydrogenase (NAD+)
VFTTDHEQVVSCHDPASGLRAVIAIHSTALGPALGGVRFYPYDSIDDAVEDALNLSRGMAYKNALAGLDLGGGKSVIIGDPASDKSPELLQAFGRFVQSLGGRYVTACDVGTYVADMDLIARETQYVVSRGPELGGSGDPSPMTALGVFQGMRAAADHAWNTPSLRGRRVGVAGVGKVGRQLIELLLADGATVVATDVNDRALELLRRDLHQVEVVADTEALLRSGLDVYAPCALGGALSDHTVPLIDARIVCGAANNQLAHPGIEKLLVERGILYAPDYLVNAGGVIQVADELTGYDADRVRARVDRIFDTTQQVFALAAADGVPPGVAADRLAERRIAADGRRPLLLPA